MDNPSLENPPLDDLQRLLDAWTRHYRWQRSLTWMLRGLAAGLLAGWILAGGLMAHQSLLPRTFMLVTGGFGVGAAFLSGILAYVWPISSAWAARYFDLRFNLKERVSTALETVGHTGADAEMTSLALQQRRDALETARQIDYRHQMAMRFPRREILALSLILLAIASLFKFGQPAFQAALQYQREQQAILAQTENLTDLITQIERNPQLSPEQQQALTQPLRQAQADLSQAASTEQGVSILTRAEDQLHSLSSPQLQEQIESLQALGETLDGPLNHTAQALKEGDLEGAAQELQSLEPGELSAQEQAGLAEDLEAAAGSLQSTQPELAGALRSAAQALRQGDAQAAQSHLAAAAQALQQTARQADLAQAAEQAAAALNQGSQQLAQQSQPEAGTGQAPGASTGSQAGSSSASNNPGNATGGSADGPGSGAGQGESPGQIQPGEGAGSQPIESANQPDGGGERVYEPIYAPSRIGGDGGEQVQLPGSQTPGDEISGESPASPGEAGGGQVPYVDVFPEYEQSARQAVESGQVPPHLRSLVRDYFSALEP